MTCLLLKKGADPSIANKSGIMPSDIAHRTRSEAICRVFARYNALPQKEGTLNDPLPLLPSATDKIKLPFFAGQNGQIDIAQREKFQLALETRQISLVNAAYIGLKNLPQSLNDGNRLLMDEGGCNILMKACYRGHLDLVNQLLEKNYPLDNQDSRGHTALIWAVVSGNTKIALRLIEAGATVQGLVFSRDGEEAYIHMSPLVAACYRGDYQLVKHLLEKGANPNASVGGKERTALHISCWFKHKSIVALLRRHKAVVEPGFDVWLTHGLITIKKNVIDSNLWYSTVSEGKNKKRISMVAAESKRASLQEKVVYCTSEDMDQLAEISKLLSKQDVPELPDPLQIKRDHARNSEFRRGMDLDRIIGNNADQVLKLAEHLKERGTELDSLWAQVFNCLVQLVMAADKNIKHQYIAISAKLIHNSAEMVRTIEFADKQTEVFSITPVRSKVREQMTSITTEYPKRLMMATRMAIGVWPPPDAVTEMIREASVIVSECCDLAVLANTLGYFPLNDQSIQVNVHCLTKFQAFEDESPVQEEMEADKGKRLKGGLNYAEYKRQNNLKLLEQLSKRYDADDNHQAPSPISETVPSDLDFFAKLDNLVKQFVGAVSDLKNAYEHHLIDEFVKTTLIMQERVDTLIEELQQHELLRDMQDDLLIDQQGVFKLESQGVQLTIPEFPALLKPFYVSAIQEAQVYAQYTMSRAQEASLPMAEGNSAINMLKSTIPCVMAVKRLVVLAKEATSRIRNINPEERIKREQWKKECLQNERVKELFSMWESQVLGDAHPGRQKTMQTLTQQELQLLEENMDSLVFDDNKNVKGGKLGQLVMLATHYSKPDEEFTTALLMTHHSFTTSLDLMDQLVKRYDITPPYGLNQRMFEVYLDKKVVQVRLRFFHLTKSMPCVSNLDQDAL